MNLGAQNIAGTRSLVNLQTTIRQIVSSVKNLNKN